VIEPSIEGGMASTGEVDSMTSGGNVDSVRVKVALLAGDSQCTC